MAGSVFLVERQTAFGERERLFVPMLQHHDAGLVAADRPEQIVGVDERREALGLTERGHRLVVAAELGERHAGQGMDERQVTAIPGGVERRRRFRNVLAHGRGVADVAVALPELVVRESNAARIVGQLGLFERAAVQRDRA